MLPANRTPYRSRANYAPIAGKICCPCDLFGSNLALAIYRVRRKIEFASRHVTWPAYKACRCHKKSSHARGRSDTLNQILDAVSVFGQRVNFFLHSGSRRQVNDVRWMKVVKYGEQFCPVENIDLLPRHSLQSLRWLLNINVKQVPVRMPTPQFMEQARADKPGSTCD